MEVTIPVAKQVAGVHSGEPLYIERIGMKMKRKHIFVSAAVVMMVLAAFSASASVLSVGAGTFQGATTSVTNCTTAANLTYNNNLGPSGFVLDGVNITTNAACANKFVNLAHSTKALSGATQQAGAFGVPLDASGNACVKVNNIDASLWGNPTATNPAHTQADISVLIKDTADATPPFYAGWFISGAC
jgi:hypothetical protein